MVVNIAVGRGCKRVQAWVDGLRTRVGIYFLPPLPLLVPFFAVEPPILYTVHSGYVRVPDKGSRPRAHGLVYRVENQRWGFRPMS